MTICPPNNDKIIYKESNDPRTQYDFESWTNDTLVIGTLFKDGTIVIKDIKYNPYKFSKKR
jgi:hypothetical protein